jgi:hypothetical protein
LGKITFYCVFRDEVLNIFQNTKVPLGGPHMKLGDQRKWQCWVSAKLM